MFPRHDDFAVRTLGLPGHGRRARRLLRPRRHARLAARAAAGLVQLGGDALARAGARRDAAALEPARAALAHRRRVGLRGAPRRRQLGPRGRARFPACLRRRQGDPARLAERRLHRRAHHRPRVPPVVARSSSTSSSASATPGCRSCWPATAAARPRRQRFRARFGVDLANLQTSFDAFLEGRFKGPRAGAAPVEAEMPERRQTTIRRRSPRSSRSPTPIPASTISRSRWRAGSPRAAARSRRDGSSSARCRSCRRRWATRARRRCSRRWPPKRGDTPRGAATSSRRAGRVAHRDRVGAQADDAGPAGQPAGAGPRSAPSGLLTLDPFDATAHAEVGRAALAAGDLPAAIRALERALALGARRPGDATHRPGRGVSSGRASPRTRERHAIRRARAGAALRAGAGDAAAGGGRTIDDARCLDRPCSDGGAAAAAAVARVARIGRRCRPRSAPVSGAVRSLGARSPAPSGRSGLRWRFARVQYSAHNTDAFRARYWSDPWAIDGPAAEQNLSRRVRTVTAIDVEEPVADRRSRARSSGSNPWVYFVEPGTLRLKESEVPILREFLLRGGTAVLDDFHGPIEWDNVVGEFARVFPDREIVELPPDHPGLPLLLRARPLSAGAGARLVLPGPHLGEGRLHRPPARHRGRRRARDGAHQLEHRHGRRHGVVEREEYPGYAPHTADAYRMMINEIIYSLTH